ncbi:Hypothetical protein PBC10988_7370 [Planctomycetales bacterium 10988]|nr:Hypothetical protein PBC10988_7370 [Planctomycetales bacterium 10988]
MQRLPSPHPACEVPFWVISSHSATALTEALTLPQGPKFFFYDVPFRGQALLAEAINRDPLLAIWGLLLCEKVNRGDGDWSYQLASSLLDRFLLEQIEEVPFDATHSLTSRKQTAIAKLAAKGRLIADQSIALARHRLNEADFPPDRYNFRFEGYIRLRIYRHQYPLYLKLLSTNPEQSVEKLKVEYSEERHVELDQSLTKDSQKLMSYFNSEKFFQIIKESIEHIETLVENEETITADWLPDQKPISVEKHLKAYSLEWRSESEQNPLIWPHLAKLHERNRRLEDFFLFEKMEALAEFAAGAGHEINNPLANISGRAQLLLRSEADPDRKRDLANINWQARRVQEMISDLMLFARPPKPRLEELRWKDWLDTAFPQLAKEISGGQIELILENQTKNLPFRFDSSQLFQVMQALIRNASEAIDALPAEEGGTIYFYSKVIETDLTMWANRLGVFIADTGIGWSEEAKKHAFDPFYSERQAGRGLGFGLSKCWQILQQHQSSIRILEKEEFPEELPDRSRFSSCIELQLSFFARPDSRKND